MKKQTMNKRLGAFGLALTIGVLTFIPAAPIMAATAWTKNNGQYTTSFGTTVNGVVARGIDVSHLQGTIDWNKVKADDVSFVMTNLKYNGGLDPNFQTNINGAVNSGLYVGVYLYSYATTTQMAIDEANFVIEHIKDYPISYPVVMDLESSVMSSLSSDQMSDIANAFCTVIKEAGYYPMVYANDYWLKNKINMSKVPYDVWVAKHDAAYTYVNPSMWQATGAGRVNGIDGNSNINFAFKDYSTLIPRNSWKLLKGSWYYYKDYKKQVEWANDGSHWYYLGNDGKMRTSWLQSSEGYYYMKDNGQMATGWQNVNNIWYYLNPNGLMATKWVNDNNNWYYFEANGSMSTGWINDNNTFYYMKESGIMAVGWQNIGGTFYYFESDGKMVTGSKQIDGITYYFNAEGKMATGWIQQNSDWYYYNNDGKMITGWQDDGSNKYYLKENGVMSTGWGKIGNDWYYFNAAGQMQTGWYHEAGNEYYLNPSSGIMTVNTTISIDGINYAFNASGQKITETDPNAQNNQPSGTPDSQDNTPQSGNTAGPGGNS